MNTKGGLFLVCALLVASTLTVSVVPSVALADELEEELIALEKAGWDAWEKGDKSFLASFTEDAIYVVPGSGAMSGIEAIQAHVENHGCDVRSVDFADFDVRELSSDVAVVNYIVTQDMTCDGQKLPGTIFATSVYVRQDGEWLVTNYQETAL
jgi:uncharacterized protein (TIGR02246 family)